MPVTANISAEDISEDISQRTQYAKGGIGKWYWDKRDEAILTHVAGAATVLDAGCGEGITTEKIIARFPEAKVTGVDVDPRNIKICEQYGLPVREGSLYSLPFENNSFDVCLLIEVIEHLHEPEKALMELARVAKPGGKVIVGYRIALDLACDICVKIDSDGQMDPTLLPQFVHPILSGRADYTKGNRFFNPDDLRGMPKARLFGNLRLSFLSKMSTGYWDVFDPTNGYTAIHSSALSVLPLDKIAQRYFFETDMLFRLNLAHAVVLDIPMRAHYGNEESSLSPFQSLFEFSFRHMAGFMKRVGYKYFLRDFNFGSLCLVFAVLLMVFGAVFSIINWMHSANLHITTAREQ